jgi:hypothetical protein
VVSHEKKLSKDGKEMILEDVFTDFYTKLKGTRIIQIQ